MYEVDAVAAEKFIKKKALDVKATDQALCDNTPVTPTPITTAIAKIPVVLAELTVQINVDAKINLPEPAIEIKRVGKRLKVTQCRLLQNTNKLFISGFVRKNIEYSTRKSSNRDGICGNISHCTVDVPWSCVTAVDFNVGTPAPALFNFENQFEYLVEQDLGPKFPAKDRLMSGDLTELNQVSTEFFNELPFCELISATITEFNEAVNRKDPYGENPFEEFEFTSIQEKMVIDLTLKILQNQQVEINGVSNNG
ncbi:CsxC family protein [Desulfallas thermosapovorans]|uniref:DUF7852 domain-containing protein n=1 Tax=Desulfallas thermosapovorans DSM 6562 TaxID=1121431 RepID=A0A5S4ZR87_9FIRM|nr:hypothetical protein [Desulfallas thermosapovorans]TYO95323.1 hypothetical protein LX24_01673 [Desulfallas thermosapovorans DSM 6562]